jgi:uncharacterized protein YecA (UPF0149 family)
LSVNNLAILAAIPVGTTAALFAGAYLQQQINDTEYTTIKLLDFNLNSSTGEWEGTFFFEVTDHFGLDKRDALKFQTKHSGFAAWWLLQHKRDYRPFKTKVWVKATLGGDMN